VLMEAFATGGLHRRFSLSPAMRICRWQHIPARIA
jgi:hypothetical protein